VFSNDEDPEGGPPSSHYTGGVFVGRYGGRGSGDRGQAEMRVTAGCRTSMTRSARPVPSATPTHAS